MRAVIAALVRRWRRRRDHPPDLPHQVAGLMRAGGWRRVTVGAAMGQLGTDVVGLAADGRRWVVRCHPDAVRLGPAEVRRFAQTFREFRRGEVAVLVTDQPVTTALWDAALRCRTTLVDRAGLIWWARVQAGLRPPAALTATARPDGPGPVRDLRSVQHTQPLRRAAPRRAANGP